LAAQRERNNGGRPPRTVILVLERGVMRHALSDVITAELIQGMPELIRAPIRMRVICARK
jgi:hypothetical protein